MRLINLPEPWGLIYEMLSNGFFAVWLMRVWTAATVSRFSRL